MGTYSQATVYDQIGARDEGGAVGGEKQGGFTNIVRHPATPEGMKRGRLLCYRPRIGGMSQVFLPEARVNITGTNASHADVPAR